MTHSHPILNTTQIHSLNKLTTTQNNLVLLRVLNTSDFAFHYQMFNDQTINGILECIKDTAEIEKDSHGLTVAELEEFHYLINKMG